MRGACACTGLAAKIGDTFATVGEDGRMNIMCIENRQPVREIGESHIQFVNWKHENERLNKRYSLSCKTDYVWVVIFHFFVSSFFGYCCLKVHKNALTIWTYSRNNKL